MRWVTLLSIVAPTLLAAQSLILHGTVALQNSVYDTGRRQYISDASVRASLAKPAVSDRSGKFTLEFSGASTGTSVRLTVDKPGYEVVNMRDMQGIVLGSALGLEVVMADAEKLAKAQEDFYGIATDAITAGYHRKVAVLREENVELADRLAVFSAEHEQRVSTLLDAIEVLTAERERAMVGAVGLAQQLATTDLDKASDLFRQAFSSFKRGEVDATLMMLNQERLDADYASARAERERGGALITQANEAIRQVYQSHGLKANVLKATMDNLGALAEFDGMIGILNADRDAFKADAEYELALERGKVLSALSRFADAISEYGRGRDLVRTHLGMDHIEQVRFMHLASWDLMLSDSLDRAKSLLEEALALMLGHELEEPLWIADLENAYGSVLMHSGDPVAGMSRIKKGLTLRRAELPPHHPDIIHSLNGQAICHGELAEHKEAVSVYEEMDQLTRSTGEHLNGLMLASMGKACMQSGDLDRAVSLLRSSRSLLIKQYGQGHPEVFLTYLDLASCLWYQGKHDEALAMLDSTLALNAVPDEHRFTASLHHQRAYFLHESGKYEAALTSYERSLAIKQKLFGELHPSVATVHGNIANLKQDMGDLEGALREDSVVLGIREKIFGPDHPFVWDAGCQNATRLVGLERDSAALLIFRKYLPRLKEKVGYAENEGDPISVVTYETWLGLALYRQGELDSARTVFEGTVKVEPQGPVERYLYLIALDQGRDSDALDHAIRRARLLDPTATEKARKEVLTALRTLATRLGRQDVLDEFKE